MHNFKLLLPLIMHSFIFQLTVFRNHKEEIYRTDRDTAHKTYRNDSQDKWEERRKGKDI